MEDWVQLAYKKVIKYDINWNQIYTYDSVKSCIEELKISNTTMKKISDNKLLINNFYYIIQPYQIQYQDVECDNCHKLFSCQTWRIKNRKHLFCSHQCEGEYNKAKPNYECAFCGKPMHVKQSRIDKCIKNYCSKECANKDKKIRYLGKENHQYGLKGNKNSSWKSDERISFYGYKLIRVIDHPFRNCDDFVFEHRIIAEKFLLTDDNSINVNDHKYLKKEYVVHHLDFDRQNNDVSNLMIMLRNEHTSLHIKMNKKDDFISYCEKYNLDINEVYNNHLYNITHYKYISKESA